VRAFHVKATWAELVALYRLTLDRPPHNFQPRYNVCPTDPIDVVTERDGKREPNEFAADIHDRMPVFLTQEQFEPWLSGEGGAEYLQPAPNNLLQRWPVSKRVNSSKADADDVTLIERIWLPNKLKLPLQRV
jgi:putative SOS response-associated peptidase YedK